MSAQTHGFLRQKSKSYQAQFRIQKTVNLIGKRVSIVGVQFYLNLHSLNPLFVAIYFYRADLIITVSPI